MHSSWRRAARLTSVCCVTALSVGSARGPGPAATSARDARGASGAAREHGALLFRFGVVADIQHADLDDAQNFGGTEQRFYRGSLAGARRAVDGWNAEESPPLAFGVSLGDLVDGQNAGKYGDGLRFAGAPRSRSALASVKRELDRVAAPAVYHAIGNHELLNFESEAEIEAALNAPPAPPASGAGGAAGGGDDDDAGGGAARARPRHVVESAPGRSYYSFRGPAAGWRFVMLNTYEVRRRRDPRARRETRSALASLLRVSRARETSARDAL